MREATLRTSDSPAELRLVVSGADVWWEARNKTDGCVLYASNRVDRERVKRFLADAGLL